MDFDVKQAIIDRLRETKRENIEVVIEYMEKNGFFTGSCHRHHHYEGGLADHAWQTYMAALELDLGDRLDVQGILPWIGDNIAIATLLHDICNCSGMPHIKGHGRRSAGILKELGFKLTAEEFLAIRFHMGLHNKTTHPLYEQALNSRLWHLVHKADGKSAKQGEGWNSDGDVSVFERLCNLFGSSEGEK